VSFSSIGVLRKESLIEIPGKPGYFAGVKRSKGFPVKVAARTKFA
jgi:hypothetical protein